MVTSSNLVECFNAFKSNACFEKKKTDNTLRKTYLVVTEGEKKKNLKTRTLAFKNNAGRNNQGKITVYTKGGGHKKKYRLIEFQRNAVEGIVESIEYDPFRTANIARVFCRETKEHFYIISPETLKRGHFVSFFDHSDPLNFKVGSSYRLGLLPLGLFVHNISFQKRGDGKIARSAGTHAQLISKANNYCRLRLNSGEHRLFHKDTIVSLGVVSNSLHKLTVLGKAGRNRWKNRRPTVRGVAMNPIDHPHGGGEGRTSGGRPSVTPWGHPTRGRPTKKKTNKLIVKKKK